MANRTCSEDGCDDPHLARGLCSKHYQRLKAAGCVPRRIDYATVEERFWSKVNKDGPPPEHRPELGACWLWEGATQSFGYGDMHLRRPIPTRLPHRFSWIVANGPIADGLFVLHRCDVPICIRPAHLFLGTQADNMADKVAKGRQARRSRNGAARLSDEQYASILTRIAAGERKTDIAASLGVTIQAVSQFAKRNRGR